MNGNNVGLRIVAALVLIAAGGRRLCLQAGIAQDRRSPSITSGETAPPPSPYGYGMPFIVHRTVGPRLLWSSLGFFHFLRSASSGVGAGLGTSWRVWPVATRMG
jgi:hypothetical protein